MEYKCLDVNSGGEKGARIYHKFHVARVSLVIHLGWWIASTDPRMLADFSSMQREVLIKRVEHDCVVK